VAFIFVMNELEPELTVKKAPGVVGKSVDEV